jgi:hypothetical protein
MAGKESESIIKCIQNQVRKVILETEGKNYAVSDRAAISALTQARELVSMPDEVLGYAIYSLVKTIREEIAQQCVQRSFNVSNITSLGVGSVQLRAGGRNMRKSEMFF